MADPRLISIDLDERTILWRSDEIEQERRIAILDLLDRNHFEPLRRYPEGYAGPYRLALSVQDGRLVLDISSENQQRLETIILALGGLRRPIRDYFAMCDAYYKAIAKVTPEQLEPIDMARRALHNEAAGLLIDRLKGKIEVDFDTARRLFTLVCVLHIRG
ncbi:uncharacterized protein (UPF0262 family) [Sphingomonas vulcanisoli]|uniref:UPF0262 protein FHS31_000671 n=1 Tax=Sphingomonas vulcanisoli TaxID=1658060 RepID=A0ABX0TNJ8_9SPHN|nr:UPF0262 family protein [Sphingomonas vulcanisoli]NIJ07089.1 uncharacterized protein (UPF0262 family) [Sphingomonas vulcanisoli]